MHDALDIGVVHKASTVEKRSGTPSPMRSPPITGVNVVRQKHTHRARPNAASSAHLEKGSPRADAYAVSRLRRQAPSIAPGLLTDRG